MRKSADTELKNYSPREKIFIQNLAQKENIRISEAKEIYVRRLQQKDSVWKKLVKDVQNYIGDKYPVHDFKKIPLKSKPKKGVILKKPTAQK